MRRLGVKNVTVIHANGTEDESRFEVEAHVQPESGFFPVDTPIYEGDVVEFIAQPMGEIPRPAHWPAGEAPSEAVTPGAVAPVMLIARADIGDAQKGAERAAEQVKRLGDTLRELPEDVRKDLAHDCGNENCPGPWSNKCREHTR